MENRFLEAEDHLKRVSRRKRCAPRRNGSYRTAVAERPATSYQASEWSKPLAATDRSLVILIENGGVDLGIPELVSKLLEAIPKSDLIPEEYKQKLVGYIRDKLKTITDNLIETLELSLNRYSAAKPSFYGDVVTLRDGTSSYDDLKNKLLDLSRKGRIIDLFILTHGSGDYISVPGGVNSQKIRDMKTELGSPLKLRSVYMMNCVGSSLNQAWIDAGAKVSSGAKRNNYLPEPSMFFFWKNWKAGQTFESAATQAYTQTINVMNAAVRGFISSLPIPGASFIASRFNIEEFDFVQASAPVITGQGSVTISTDNLSFTQTISSSLTTTVLPLSVLQSLNFSQAKSNGAKQTISPAGVDFIKGWEGFVAKPYNDPVGHCTVGYGTLLHTGNCDGRPVEEPYVNGITQEKATELLAEKAAEFQLVIDSNVKVALNQNQYDALVSFAYNVGGANFQKSTLLKLLNKGDYNAVPTELKKWTKARQNGKLVDLPGLVKRRAAEAELFQKSVAAAAAQSMSAAFASDWSRSFSNFDYTIPPTLQVIGQPDPKTCWAAVMTMMWCWKNNQSMAIPDVLAQIGPAWVDRFKAGKGLDSKVAKDLYDSAGLIQLISFNPTIEGWLELLQTYGPLYVDVGYNTGKTTHAIIVIGIKGDGTPQGTTITYVDPLGGGKTVPMKFSDFLVKYEAASAVRWPYTIVHWPAGAQVSSQQSLPIRHRYSYESSDTMTSQTPYSLQQNPVVAGIAIADAAQIGLGAASVVQDRVEASRGDFSLTYDKVSRLLTNEARQAMPGAQRSKKSYSRQVLHLGIGAINAAKADVIVEWEGNDYGEIGTPVFSKRLSTSTDWTMSSADITISKIDRIPLPNTDPRGWPIYYDYKGTYNPYGNGKFEFYGTFWLDAFGGLKFTKHEVVSRSLADWAIGGKPENKVQRGPSIDGPVPTIPQEQLDYLKTKLP